MIRKLIKSKNPSLSKVELDGAVEAVKADLSLISETEASLVEQPQVSQDVQRVMTAIENYSKHLSTSSFSRLQNVYLKGGLDIQEWLDLVDQARSLLPADKWNEQLQSKLVKLVQPSIPTPAKAFRTKSSPVKKAQAKKAEASEFALGVATPFRTPNKTPQGRTTQKGSTVKRSGATATFIGSRPKQKPKSALEVLERARALRTQMESHDRKVDARRKAMQKLQAS